MTERRWITLLDCTVEVWPGSFAWDMAQRRVKPKRRVLSVGYVPDNPFDGLRVIDVCPF